MEYKQINSPKVVKGRTVVGFAAVLGNIDGVGDRIMPGAFKKTISESSGRIRHLWMHDPYQPPTAVITDLVELDSAQLPEELVRDHPEVTGGLQVSREYLETPRGDEILKGVKSGAITEMSIGYSAIKFDFEEVSRDGMTSVIRNLREIRLFDTSDVVWGANELTLAAKSELFPALAFYQSRMSTPEISLISDIAAVLQSSLSDSWKSGRVLSARNLERLKSALDTLSEILLAAEPSEDDQKRLASLTESLRYRISIAEKQSILES